MKLLRGLSTHKADSNGIKSRTVHVWNIRRIRSKKYRRPYCREKMSTREIPSELCGRLKPLSAQRSGNAEAHFPPAHCVTLHWFVSQTHTFFSTDITHVHKPTTQHVHMCVCRASHPTHPPITSSNYYLLPGCKFLPKCLQMLLRMMTHFCVRKIGAQGHISTSWQHEDS